MPKTKEEIIKIFHRAYADYAKLIDSLDDEDYPIVESLIDDNNPYLAGKVVSYIGLLKTQKALSGLAIAARSQNPSIKAVAAHALKNFTNFPEAISLIEKLLDDRNVGVRKFALRTVDVALRTVDAAKLVIVKNKVQQLSLNETNERMKILSGRVRDNLSKFDNSDIIIR